MAARSRALLMRGRYYLWIMRAVSPQWRRSSANPAVGAGIHDRQNTASGRLRKGSALFIAHARVLHMPAEIRQKARSPDDDSLTLDELPDLNSNGQW